MDEVEVLLITSGLLIFFCGVPLLFINCFRESRDYDLVLEN